MISFYSTYFKAQDMLAEEFTETGVLSVEVIPKFYILTFKIKSSFTILTGRFQVATLSFMLNVIIRQYI